MKAVPILFIPQMVAVNPVRLIAEFVQIAFLRSCKIFILQRLFSPAVCNAQRMKLAFLHITSWNDRCVNKNSVGNLMTEWKS